jgi:hypothetical protein
VGQHFWLSEKDFNYISNETVALSGAHISTETLLRKAGLAALRTAFTLSTYADVGKVRTGKCGKWKKKESKKCSENKGGGQGGREKIESG